MELNKIYEGDCLDVLKTLPDNTIDCCVTTFTDYERGYLEALIDGEGSLSLVFSKQRTSPRPRVDIRLSITNINKEILEKVKTIIGAGSICSKRPKGNRRPVFVYQASSTAIRYVLPQLDLIVKREQKEIIIECLSMLTGSGGRRKGFTGGLMRPLWKDERFAVLKQRLNELNRRGVEKANHNCLINSRYAE